MTNVHDLPCVPSVETMHEIVQRIFEHTGQVEGGIEIGSTDTRLGLHPPHPLNQGRKFQLGNLDEAVEHAAKLNATPNCNVYFSAGICRVGSFEHSRASDADIEHVAACWVDLDAPGALPAAILAAESMALRPNLITFTGLHPSPRGQMWWIFDEPTADLALHRRLQMALVHKFGGDPTVINPSRVMRLCGSVAWPIKAERVLELTGVYPDAEIRREPYSMDEFVLKMTRFAGLGDVPEMGRVRATPKFTGATAEPGNVLDFNAAEPQLDLESLISEAAKPHQWHRNALLATAHLLGKGMPPDLVLTAITGRLQQPGYDYHDTRNELVVMMEGAMRRGMYRPFTPDPEQIAVSDALYAQAGEPRPGFVEPARPASPFMTIDQVLDLPPAEWLVDGYLPTRGMSALFAPPSAFKSFLALDIGLSVAYGLPWHGFATRQRKVLYIVAEGKHAFGRRIRVWQEHRAEGEGTDQFHLLAAPVNLSNSSDVEAFMDAIDEHLGGVGLVIVDTVARNYGPGDENSTKDMNAYVAGSTLLAERGAHVLHVHHAGKDSSRGERGSSAFLGALDTSLKLDRETGSDVATLYVKKQKDGPEAAPLRFAFPIVEGSHPRTGEAMESRVPTLAGDAVAAVSAAPRSKGAGLSTQQRELVKLVGRGVNSLTALASAVRADKSNIRASLLGLKERGLVFQDSNSQWMPVVGRKAEEKQDDE